ncbi:MAG: hypothetical protein HOW73_16255 [Polyangiaceae bacterium]|nr:hypothetical protein [Polyangiaceae bacterium]
MARSQVTADAACCYVKELAVPIGIALVRDDVSKEPFFDALVEQIVLIGEPCADGSARRAPLMTRGHTLIVAIEGAEGRTIGALGVGKRTERNWSVVDLRRLTDLARFVATSVESRKQVREQRRPKLPAKRTNGRARAAGT